LSGIKQTFGLVSKEGCVPLGYSLDHIGPMARTARDCAIMLQVMAGYDTEDFSTVPLPVDDYVAALPAGVRGLRLGIPRGYFYDRLDEEIARAERHQSPLAVAFFDIDELKAVNDTYGHLAGNEVLRVLGQTIAEKVRAEDVPARYGGDEFAIVMPDTPREEAEKVVVRLMEILDDTSVTLPGGGSIKMPARSWGVSSYPLDGRTAEALVENADTRAYARKRGR
jgi:diguanylate cyclase (GGDEF)-like protein